MFRNREEAGFRLAARLKGRAFRDPLVLAIPHGGVVTGAVLASELNAELDVALCRKLRAPGWPEFAIGAVTEDGGALLTEDAAALGVPEWYLVQERNHQLAEINRRARLFRRVRPPAAVAGRSVIVTDDGIATGSTMTAALKLLRAQGAHELVVAVPVAAADSLAGVRRWCDDAVCLLCPDGFRAVGQFYEDFPQIEDAQVVALLRDHGVPRPSPGRREVAANGQPGPGW
jgi:predicted phosphoribosyltransferase